MNEYDAIVRILLEHYPTAQAIYLFGTCGTADEWPDSDVDIALLLSPAEAKRAADIAVSDARGAIELLLRKDVDLINLRLVSTVFQKEIIMAERRIFCADEYAADEFEMLMLSRYQKLNEERAQLLAEGLRSGSFYSV
ncbi:MAG: nucleotidyltransferase domain-containing protein [Candidatus Coatesbacteria bacterium]|nr:nucleotidyltransferase domain-containing protein [Candidatus Coatesbacteria bacterium]